MGNVKDTLVKWLEDNPEGWKNTDAFNPQGDGGVNWFCE